MSAINQAPAGQDQQQLWNAIRQTLSAARTGSPMQSVSRDGVLPLSFAQQRFWFMEQLAPGTFVNNLTTAFELTGPLNQVELARSWGEICRRHEILRTSFPLLDGRSTQSIAACDPDLTGTLGIVDLQGLPEIDRARAASHQFTQLAQQPFDLSKCPLLRGKLICLAPETHRLIIVIHHIICDGISIEIFFRELGAVYTAFSSGKPSPLVDLTIQYADFAVWQQQRLKDNQLNPQLEYWRQQLGGVLPLLQLPIDRPRPPIQTVHGAYRFFNLSHQLSTDLQALSQRQGVTLFMTFLAAFQTLLYRYSGQTDLIVGAPIAGRNRTEIAGSIGCFVNTLVLRTNLDGNPSFEELLSRVKQVAIGAYAHQDLPLEQLIAALNPPRDLSRSPLFQVMLIFEHVAEQSWSLPELTITPFKVERIGIAKFDLTLNLTETNAGIEGGIEYNTDLFDPETIERMVGHFQILLAGIVADPAQTIAELPLLTAAERQQILWDWNDTTIDYPQTSCIHQLFEAQVQRTPDAVAIICGAKQLTYHQLNCQANQLADRLHQLGVTADTLVGILLERSIDLVIGLIGILKAGAAYVPLDPSYPLARISYMLADAGVEILLTQSTLLAAVPSPPAQVICMDNDGLETYCSENIDRGVNSTHLAYVLYTSGSTGQPKGVAIEHRSVVNFLAAMAREPGIEPTDTLAAVTTISFDIAGLELYLPLTVGAKVVVIPREIAIDPNLLLATLRTTQTTILQATPATWQLLLAGGWNRDYPLKVLCGGEALPAQLAQQILATGSQLWNLYGPTETTIWSTSDRVGITQSVDSSDALVSIGRPIANTQVYILNQQLQPAPIGVAGELYIGGDGLARGYFDRPELTAEKFIPHPFNPDTSARLYKTGDLARYLSDGKIEFLGRIDNLVKIRGFRIELGEIETALSQHPLVSQAVVIAGEINPGSKTLIAYVVAGGDLVPTATELRSFLQDRLPEYMVPTIFLMLDTLPLTANGKIDRRALPIPNQANLEPTATFVSPQDGLELQLTKIWERVLGIGSIGTSDNFFDLGGHSILAVQLFAAIATTLGQKLPLATLFQAPMIDQLAEILRQQPGSTAWSALVPIAARGSKPPLFCAHPVGGNVLEYYPLAAHLGADQPIYGLQSSGLDGVQDPFDRIEDMATHYIREIKTVQPHGPYFLAGYSFGALVAFEIACQLEHQDETIGLLALIDQASPSLSEVRPPLFQSIKIHLQNLYQLSILEQVKYIKNRLIFRLLYQNKQNNEMEFLVDYWGVPLPPEYLKVLAVNFQAAGKYHGKPYRGKALLFRSGVQPLTCALYPDLGWTKLISGEIEICPMRGDHNNLLKEPQIQILAQKLKAGLNLSKD